LRLGLSGGDPVEILERDGHLEIGVVASVMRLEESDQGPVAVPEEDLPPPHRASAKIVSEFLESR